MIITIKQFNVSSDIILFVKTQDLLAISRIQYRLLYTTITMLYGGSTELTHHTAER